VTFPFSPSLFWDCDPALIDVEVNRLFVIGRVLTRGRYTDWLALKELYGVDRLRHEVTQLRSLDPRTLAFCCVYFDLPKESFRCCTKTPSSSPEPSLS
jgi:hypothetical protein